MMGTGGFGESIAAAGEQDSRPKAGHKVMPQSQPDADDDVEGEEEDGLDQIQLTEDDDVAEPDWSCSLEAGRVVVKVQLPGLDSMANVELEVEEEWVEVVVPGELSFSKSLPWRIDVDSASAAFDKSTHVLSITAQLED